MDIGCRIAERRKELGITQESLAEKLSISPQAVIAPAVASKMEYFTSAPGASPSFVVPLPSVCPEDVFPSEPGRRTQRPSSVPAVITFNLIFSI